MRCVDNSLLLVKNKDVNHILKCLNSFDKNIKFTNDTFSDGNKHLLDIKADKIRLIFTIKIPKQNNTQASTVKDRAI